MAAQETTVQTGASRAKRYVREVRAELKKVAWPTRRELFAFSGVVFVSVVVVSALIWLIDTSFSGLLLAIIR